MPYIETLCRGGQRSKGKLPSFILAIYIATAQLSARVSTKLVTPSFSLRMSEQQSILFCPGMPTECTSNSLQRELADSILRCSSIDDLRILIACGASPNEPVTQGIIKLRKLLKCFKGWPTHFHSIGLRPLHYAVWQNYLEAVQFLLVRGSDVNAKDDNGYTALHFSAEHGYCDIMKILLDYQVL